MSIEQEILAIVNQIPAAIEKAFYDVFVLRHPGHANQKTHGNRFGAGQAKESLRRLKEDKGAREQYKQKHREKNKPSSSPWYGKGQETTKPKQGASQPKTVDLSPTDTGIMSAISNSSRRTESGEGFLMGPASKLSEGIGFKTKDKEMATKYREALEKGLLKEHPVLSGTSRYTLTELGKKLLK